jgi:hypothetical protein
LVGNGFAAVCIYRISQRYYPVPYDQGRILRVLLITVVLGLSALYLDSLIPIGATLSLLKGVIVASYPCLIVVAVLHPADLAAARAIFRNSMLARGSSR